MSSARIRGRCAPQRQPRAHQACARNHRTEGRGTVTATGMGTGMVTARIGQRRRSPPACRDIPTETPSSGTSSHDGRGRVAIPVPAVYLASGGTRLRLHSDSLPPPSWGKLSLLQPALGPARLRFSRSATTLWVKLQQFCPLQGSARAWARRLRNSFWNSTACPS